MSTFIISLAFRRHPFFPQNNRAIIREVCQGDNAEPKTSVDFGFPPPSPQLSRQVYNMALYGFQKLIAEGKISKNILTIIDFSKPSTEKRLFLVDLNSTKLLVNTWVAHGRNSGENLATRFSNLDANHQSSLGFYFTGSAFVGSNGYSLKLIGLEPRFNDNAEQRGIVMHGANYVSGDMVKHVGRLGRSWGGPAVSKAENRQIINLIKGGSCIFMYAPQQQYLASSKLLSGFPCKLSTP